MIRRHFFFLGAILALAAGSLRSQTSPEQKPITIEAAQRVWQERFILMTGTAFSWPARSDGTTPGTFPDDCFYEIDYGNKARMAALVQDLVNKMRAQPAVLNSFLVNPADENLHGKSNFNTFPIPSLPAVTVSNYESIFEYLVRVYLSRLNVIWTQAQTVAPDSDSIASPKVTGTVFYEYHAETCAEAKQMVKDERLEGYIGGDIGVYEFIYGNPDTSAFYKYQAGLEVFAGRFHVDMRGIAGSFRSHIMLIPQAGTPMNLPPEVTAIGTFISQASGSTGSNWFSQIYYPPVFDFSLPCPSPGQQLHHEWSLISIVTIKPDFHFAITEPFGDCKTCATCTADLCGAGSPNAKLGSIDFTIGLGGSVKGLAGALRIRAETPSAALASPASLLRSVGEGVTVIVDPTRASATGVAAPRQLLAPQALVDVVVIDAYSYELRFYTRANAGARGSDGLYQPTGSALRTYRIENPDRSPTVFNRLRISRPDDASEPEIVYAYNAGTATWSLTQGSGDALRTESNAVRIDSTTGDRIETHSVFNATGQETFREEKTYRQFPWNIPSIEDRKYELTKHVIDPTGAALTTTCTYYTDSAVDGVNYGRLRRQLDASGNWTEYTYDSSGRAVTTKRPFRQAPVGATTNVIVTTTTYATSAPQETEITTVVDASGTSFEVSRRFRAFVSGEVRDIVAQTVGAAWTAADNLVTTSRYYSSGSFRGDLSSVRAPDGTLTTYSYQLVVDGKITTVARGAPDAGGTTVVDGVRTVTKVNTAGIVVSEEQYDIASGLLMDMRLATAIDASGRPTRIDYADGTFETRVYSCCTLESETDRQGIVTTYTYDSRKRRVSATRAGVTQRSTLDPDGRQLTVTRIGSDGSEILQQTNVYDRAGRLSSTKDARNRLTTFAETIDTNGLTVKTTTLPDLATRIERFHPDGLPQSIAGTAATPRKFVYGVDAAGSFTQEILPGSAGEETEWVKRYTDLVGRDYKTVFPDGASSQSFFNAGGQLVRQVDADGVTRLLQYNARGEAEYTALDLNRNGTIDFSGTDRIQRRQQAVVNAHGTVVARTTVTAWITDGTPDTQTISIEEISTDGRQSWQTDAGLTSQSTRSFDGTGGRVETITRPDGAQRVATFSADRLVSIETKHPTLGRLSLETRTYDPHGRVLTTTDAATGTTTFAYFADDQLMSVTSPDPDPTRTGDGYDPQTTTYDYDEAGRENKITQPGNAVVEKTFYPTGQMKRAWGARTYPQEYTYDAQGRVKTLTTWQNFAGDSGKAVTTWNYHAQRGWLIAKRYADNQGPSYTYTASGRVQSHAWARGVSKTYSYNNGGDLAGIDYSDATTDAAFTYDRLGRLLTKTDGGGICTFAYEGVTPLIATETYGAGLLNGVTLSRSYDALQRVSGITIAPGAIGYATGYAYDAASRPQLVTSGLHTATYGYRANSPLVESINFANNGAPRLTTTRSYDALNRLAGIANSAGAASASVSYLHNSSNQRIRATREDGAYWSYAYDSLGQITTDQKRLADGTLRLGHAFSYQYDTIGNRSTATANGQTRTYTTNALNQYSTITVPPGYDVLGTANPDAIVTVNNQPTQRQGEFFSWSKTVTNATAPVFESLTIVGVRNNVGPNGEDAVATQTRTAFVPQTPEAPLYDVDGNLTLDGRWSYAWDAENRLVAMETNPAAALAGAPKLKLEFAYDGQNRRIGKKVSTWNGTAWVLTSHTLSVYDGWNTLAELNALSANAVVRSYVWGLDLSGSFQGAGGIGALLAISDRATASTHLACYDGNGNVISLVNAADGSISATYDYNAFGEVTVTSGPAAALNPFRFSTKYADNETGLIFYGFRYYDPSTGRWPSRDAIAENGGANLYGMVYNDAVNRADAIGLAVAPAPTGPVVAPPLVTPEEIAEAMRALGPNPVRAPVFIPAPGPIGGYGNDNTEPNWTNPDVATLARSSGTGAQVACRKLALASFGKNQYFYAATSHNRATGAAAVLWKKQDGELPQIDPPGWNAANQYRRGSVDRGHLIPFSYGGAGGYRNLTTQERRFNRGRFRTEIIGRLDAATNGGKGGDCKYACLMVVPLYRGQGATGVRDPGKPVPHAFTVLIVNGDGVLMHATMLQPTLVGNLANDVYPPWNTWNTGNIDLN